MAYCEKGHYYNEHEGGCPTCAQGVSGGEVPPTFYREGPGGVAVPGARVPPANAVVPPHGAPFPGSAGTAPPWARPYVPPAPPWTPAGQPIGGGTILDDGPGARRGALRGFLLVVAAKVDPVNQYFRLRRGINRIGRFGSRADVELMDPEVSSEHAIAVCTARAVRLLDLDSSNGTWVNDERVEIAELSDGDVVRVGNTTMVFAEFDWEADD